MQGQSADPGSDRHALNTKRAQPLDELGGDGFAPFGVVTSGLATLQHLYHGCDEQPHQRSKADHAAGRGLLTKHFLTKHFPKLDWILKARVLH